MRAGGLPGPGAGRAEAKAISSRLLRDCVWAPCLSLYEALALILGAATLFVLWLTLRAARRYVQETARLTESSVEQIEALQKPCVLLVTSLGDPYESAHFTDVSPLLPDRFIFKNIGKGPALNSVLELWDRKKHEMVFSERGFFVAEGGEHQATWQSPGAVPAEARLVLNYQSAGGAAYQTDVEIRGKSVVGQKFVRRFPEESITI